MRDNLAELPDDELVAQYMSLGAQAWTAPKPKDQRKFLNAQHKLGDEIAERGERLHPLLASYLDYEDPAVQFAAILICHRFLPEKVFPLWEALAIPMGGVLGSHIFGTLYIWRDKGWAPGDKRDLMKRHSAALAAQAAQRLVTASEPELTAALSANGDANPRLSLVVKQPGWFNDSAEYRFVAGDRGTFLLIENEMDDDLNTRTMAFEFRGCFRYRWEESSEWLAPLVEPLGAEVYGDFGWVGEVVNSTWPDPASRRWARHFVFPFNVQTFQCLASDLTVSGSALPLADAVVEVATELARRDAMATAEWVAWERERWDRHKAQ